MAKKKAALAGISIRPGGPLLVGNMYAAHAGIPGADVLDVTTSGTNRQYPTVSLDGETRASFFIDRAGDYVLRFLKDGEALAEISFTADGVFHF